MKHLFIIILLIASSNTVFAQQYDFAAIEKRIDIEHFTKSVVVKLFKNFRHCSYKTMNISQLSGFKLKNREKSTWYDTTTGAPGHTYNTSLLFKSRNGSYQTQLNPIITIMPKNHTKNETVTYVKVRYVQGAFPQHIAAQPNKCGKWGSYLFLSGDADMNEVLGSKYVSDISLPKKNYRGNKQVFLAQKILADEKFQLLGSRDVDGASGPRTLEAFELFNELIETPIPFEGEFTAEVVKGMQGAYKAH